MTDQPTPAAIADATMAELVARARGRDLAGALDLFLDDATLFGSGAQEFAEGRADLQEFFTTIFAQPFTYGWTWDPPVAGRHDDVVWFVAVAHAVLEGEGAPPPIPYRLSGVLRLVDGAWRFALFNGAEPAA
jgi:ketosteroid isomerase-like protein